MVQKQNIFPQLGAVMSTLKHVLCGSAPTLPPGEEG